MFNDAKMNFNAEKPFGWSFFILNWEKIMVFGSIELRVEEQEIHKINVYGSWYGSKSKLGYSPLISDL